MLCAFLDPDAIPEELFTDGASELSPTLQSVAADLLSLDSVIRTLRSFSLIHRHPETCTLTLHRLVQSVVKDEMDEYERSFRSAGPEHTERAHTTFW